MSYTVIFSSKTGNTRMIAEEIYSHLDEGSRIFALEDFNGPLGDDILVLGYWTDRGTADKEMKKFLSGLRSRRIILFGSLGAYPDSAYGQGVKKSVESLLDETNEIMGHFLCQGRIDPKITQAFMKMEGDPNHPMDEKRLKLHRDSYSHPDQDDLRAARDFIRKIIDEERIG